MNDQPLILFDGVCNFCNGVVQFVIKRDVKTVFKFASLQGVSGQELLKQHGRSQTDFSSFVLIKNNTVYTRSTAALLICKELPGAMKLLYGFIIVPVFIRNAIYDFIARNRYKWFGKQDACMIPGPVLKSRFLN